MIAKLSMLAVALLPFAAFGQNTAKTSTISQAESASLTTTAKTLATGCLTATGGQYPMTTYTPTCNAAEEYVTTAAYLNEFSPVDVTAGVTYTFSTTNSAYFITIGNEAGTTALASGIGSVTYTPTANEVVRFYSHLSSNCDGGNVMHGKIVKCGNPPVEPDYGCDQNYTGTWTQANSVNKSLNYAVANDFFVPKENTSFKLQSITAPFVRAVAEVAPTDIQSFDVVLMADSGSNSPGAVLHTWTGVVPTVTTRAEVFANYPTYDAKVNLDGYAMPINNAADTRYWISLQMTSASNSNYFWIGYNYTTGWATAPNYQSSNN